LDASLGKFARQFGNHLLLNGVPRPFGSGNPVERTRVGAKTKKGRGPRTYVPVDAEIVLSKKGDRVRVALTGPVVVMTLEEWRQWLEEMLGEV
jgi:hypothetical protein